MPAGAVLGHAVFAHCFSCGKDGLAATRVARGMAAAGIATLRFDFAGLGGSDGDFGDDGVSGDVEDVRLAATFMAGLSRPPGLLVGHSLGGTAVLAAAASLPDVRAIATIGAPSDADHVIAQFAAAVPAIEAHGDAPVRLGGRSFTVTRRFLDDVRADDQDARLRTLRSALLILHSPVDKVVGIDNAGAIFAAARHPKSFVALDKADHLLTRPQDAAYAAAVIAAWAGRYLQPAALTPG